MKHTFLGTFIVLGFTLVLSTPANAELPMPRPAAAPATTTVYDTIPAPAQAPLPGIYAPAPVQSANPSVALPSVSVPAGTTCASTCRIDDSICQQRCYPPGYVPALSPAPLDGCSECRWDVQPQACQARCAPVVVGPPNTCTTCQNPPMPIPAPKPIVPCTGVDTHCQISPTGVWGTLPPVTGGDPMCMWDNTCVPCTKSSTECIKVGDQWLNYTAPPAPIIRSMTWTPSTLEAPMPAQTLPSVPSVPLIPFW